MNMIIVHLIKNSEWFLIKWPCGKGKYRSTDNSKVGIKVNNS